MVNRIKFVFLLLLGLALLSACDDEKQTNVEATVAVRKIMAERKKAIETKDIELYKRLILPDYSDGKTTYKQQIEFIQSLFDRFKKIEFRYNKSEVNFMFNTARTTQRIYYKPDDAEKTIWDDEVTMYRRVNGKWYISGGINTGLF